ncbi:CIS tube protein [Calothrix sp. NIES-2098]|uniref:CIS tube protein n=1 Tax=Calothrix sp. NIES-2098 TaxID=1954171 RepID=UPI000B612D22|nr:peptidoglycan-binding LysM [Calothrix sp. NIES-2098]
MALEKLKIVPEIGAEITVLFNPNEITIDKTANWRVAPTDESDVPESQFTHGDPAQLTMNLLCDTYEAKTDVRTHTDKIFDLATIQKHGSLHRPPLCKLMWGKFDFNNFQWVLTNLNQRFTLFLDNGTPVRANLTCTFKQWRSDQEDAKLTNKQSPDVAKTRLVKDKERISNIAYEEYEDPTLWRAIAQANKIDNPTYLKPGIVLAIPALRPGSSLGGDI